MPGQLKVYRVFFASPGGLEDIRKVFRKVLSEYNDVEAHARGVHFQAVGAETASRGIGRPQELINQELITSDYFVMVLADRWGSDPGASASSGTEEEYKLALECWTSSERPMMQIQVFFRSVPETQMADPGPQLISVLEFKEKLQNDKRVKPFVSWKSPRLIG